MVTVAPWIWIAFVVFVLGMLFIDLFLFHRDAHEVSTREGAMWVAIWMSMGLAFTFVIWAWQGGTAAGEYIAGYLLEYSLSADNIFVFVLIFSYFAVPSVLQHRVLFWGIVGALVFRASFILAGAALLERFEFLFYVFGAFLVFTGIRMARHEQVEVHPDSNFVLRLARRFIRISPVYHGQSFIVRENGRRVATPLLAVLIVVETTDIIFAVDSIPAIFGVTRNPFLVFSSNAFAILGLRALYFLLAQMMRRFRYLQVGLSAILVFIGIKMLINHWIHVPIWASLSFILLTLTISVWISLRVEARGSQLSE
ncbi:MAG TPA: TerC family protein [Actinomycetota bacterium]|jgi:tellurite resistance protein TerC|nr:TerC family protein [Actinomycetota bacterium]